MEIRQLRAEDYDALLDTLNVTFGAHAGKKLDFTAIQPKMWVRNDEFMGKHVGVFEDGLLAAVVGIYPLPVQIMGKKFTFYTTGNVATRPQYEGRGYFTRLFSMAMERVQELGGDAARLGGARQRYGRYGFSPCSSLYRFSFSEHNRKYAFPNFADDVELVPLQREDRESLKFCMDLCNSNAFCVERFDNDDYRDVFSVMHSKECVPFVALKNGKRIGYLCAKDQVKIFEVRTVDVDAYGDILCAYQKKVGATISVPVAPHRTEELLLLGNCADEISVTSPSKFKILHFQGLSDALMQLKATYFALPEGEFLMEIEDYGTLRFFADENTCGCEHTNRAAEISVSKEMATRLIFGFPCGNDHLLNPAAKAWFPLPLTWDFMDYV